MKILIVDDSLTSRLFLANILEENGHTIHQSVDGKDVLEKIQSIHPDLVILDLLMPDVDGFEVLKILKSENIDVPIFVLSADIQDDVRKECIELGAKKFLTKPYVAEDLLAAIERLK
ncbi:PleD family two-component system response regulator [Bacteroidota bacterium]